MYNYKTDDNEPMPNSSALPANPSIAHYSIPDHLLVTRRVKRSDRVLASDQQLL